MDDAELRDQVSRLRGEGKSPKQIARALGVPPSTVAPLVRAAAARAQATAGLPPLVGCWVNAGWSEGIAVDPSRGWAGEGASPEDPAEYARGLGFEPHADFAQAADQLGAWEGPSAITFGKDGKPLYVSGPYDNPRQVMRTLERTVGPPPAFHYLVNSGA